MLYVIKTQDPDSDLFYLRYKVLPQLTGKYSTRRNYYCDAPEIPAFEQFLNNTNSISLFSTEKTLHVLYDLKTNKKEIEKLCSLTDELIIIMNPSKKDFPKNNNIVIFDLALGLVDVKRLITQQLKNISLPTGISVEDIIKKIAFADEMGNIHHSPLQAEMVIKQIEMLSKSSPGELISFLKTEREFVDHWQMISQLFEEKAKRDTYFNNLMTMFDIYEILNSLKNSLLFIGVISSALEEYIDPTSIAKTLGKHPFYIQNLIRTIRQYGISPQKATAILTRFLNLELRVKSGDLDDPELGFRILIATL